MPLAPAFVDIRRAILPACLVSHRLQLYIRGLTVVGDQGILLERLSVEIVDGGRSLAECTRRRDNNRHRVIEPGLKGMDVDIPLYDSVKQ